MEYNEDFLKKIVGVGTLGYSIEKIINVLDISDNDINNFILDFKNKNSVVYKNYKKGLDKSDYAIDMKLFELAKNGDLKALEKYEKRKIEQQELLSKELIIR